MKSHSIIVSFLIAALFLVAAEGQHYLRKLGKDKGKAKAKDKAKGRGPKVTDPEATSCPDPSPEIICYALYQPVICGDNACEYSNDCIASAAGWKLSQCTSSSP